MARVCRGVFEQYQFARVSFVQEVATMAAKPELIDVMHEEGVIHQLHPLLSDHVRAACVWPAVACYCGVALLHGWLQGSTAGVQCVWLTPNCRGVRT